MKKTSYSPAKKSAAKKTTSKRTTGNSGTEKLDVDKNTSASIRKIENGYLITESGSTGKGKNQQWFDRQYYSATNPVAGIKFGKK